MATAPAAVPSVTRRAILARVVLLPLGLVAATVLGLGSYYEASDDTSLSWLFSGVLAPAPVASVALYFHGYGHALAALYAAAPDWPWFGLLLGCLLGISTVLVFAVLNRLLRAHLSPVGLTVALVVFFGVGWLEHWHWFSYVRVALLLAGAALLFAAQRPGRWGPLTVGLVGLGAAWLMRPSLAMLGFGAVLPAVLLLAGSWRRAVPLIGGGVLLLAIATAGAAAWRTPAQAHTQVLDGYLARILDFDQLRPAPVTPADSLGTAAVGQWLLGDSTLVNEGLCRRAYAFNATNFYGHEAPRKLGQRLLLLARDYFLVLLALVASLIGGRQRQKRRWWFWLVQAGFAGVLLLFAGLLKLPPRLALPLLDFWLITNLAFLFAPVGSRYHSAPSPQPLLSYWSGLARQIGLALSVIATLLYGAKVWHRQQFLGTEKQQHEQTLAALNRAGAGRVRILAGSNDLLKSLSPFHSYFPGGGRTLMLSGWPSHDASQSKLRRTLSGSSDQTECLRRLARARAAGTAPAPLWVLSDEAAAWLDRRFRYAGLAVRLVPGNPLPNEASLRFYQVEADVLPAEAVSAAGR